MKAPRTPLPSARIKTRQLLLLAHLARERSLLRAADAAGMSQPAASKLLRELEDDLGVTLFDRHARGVEPTAYGDIVLRQAQAALSEIRRAQDEIAALKGGGAYRVAIGSVMSPCTDLLPRALATLAPRHAQLTVSVEVETSRLLIDKLLEGRLDIVVGHLGHLLDAGQAAELSFEPLADEPHSLIARAGHPLARRRGLQVAHLVDEAWVLPPADSLVRGRIAAMFLQRGLPLPSRVVEALSVPLITHLLRHSDMLVALPETVVRPYCDAGMLQVLPIDLQVRTDVYGLIVRRGRPLSPHVEEALSALRAAWEELRTPAP